MRIPELDLECDVLKCVRVVDRELEIVSQTFLKEIERKLRSKITSVRLYLETPTSVVLQIDDPFADPDLLEDFHVALVELSGSEMDVLCKLQT